MIITGSGIVIQGNVRIVGITVVPSIYDAQFNYVTALFYGDGANAAQNNTFLDSSSNNSSITRTGTPTQGSFSPYGNNWSNFFNGSSYLSIASNTGFEFGSGDFTIEAWAFFTSFSSIYSNAIVSKGTAGVAGADSYSFQTTSGGIIQFFFGTGAAVLSGPTLSTNTWYHLAVTRSGSTFTLWVNGASSNTATSSPTLSAGGPLIIGSQYYSPGATDRSLYGYASNLRIVKGTAVYTAAFTPPTAPLTAITNTSLLTCQSNRFVDNSSNAFAITVNSTPSIQRFNPFGNGQIAYTTSTISSSAYFNGSGDYLQTPSSAIFNLNAGNWTMEGWFYLTVAPAANQRLFVIDGGSVYGMYTKADGGIYYGLFGSSEVTMAAAGTLSGYNQWKHIAFVKSGSTTTCYVNGVSAGSTTSYSLPNSNCTVYIAGSTPYAANVYAGYISDVRVVNGTALYTTTFVPPTVPLTAVTNTNLLLSFNNAGIYDSAAMNDVITVGSAQASTSVVKYGTSSLKFNGTTDYLTIPYGNFAFEFGSGNYTIELWLYALATTGSSTVFARGNPGSLGTDYFTLEFQGNQLQHYVGAYTTAAPICAAVGITWANTWHHVAVVRNVNTWTMYVDGVAQATTITGAYTITATTSPNPSYIATSTYSTSRYFSGYIDDFRVTKGYARYTTAFTPPTAALLGG
jgi:hypothetical protein